MQSILNSSNFPESGPWKIKYIFVSEVEWLQQNSKQYVTCDQDSAVESQILGMWCMLKSLHLHSLHILRLPFHLHQELRSHYQSPCKTCIALEKSTISI